MAGGERVPETRCVLDNRAYTVFEAARVVATPGGNPAKWSGCLDFHQRAMIQASASTALSLPKQVARPLPSISR